MPGRELTKEEKLFDAVRKGKLPQVKLLLDDGIDVEARDEYGHTPLHYACMYGYPTIARMLVSGNLHGVKPATTKVHEVKLLDRGADIEARDQWDRTPLHLACVWGHPDTARLLLDRGADVNARDEWGDTPIDYACDLPESNPARQPLLEAFQELAPEAYFTKFCESQGRLPGRGM